MKYRLYYINLDRRNYISGMEFNDLDEAIRWKLLWESIGTFGIVSIEEVEE